MSSRAVLEYLNGWALPAGLELFEIMESVGLKASKNFRGGEEITKGGRKKKEPPHTKFYQTTFSTITFLKGLLFKWQKEKKIKLCYKTRKKM